MGWVRVSNGVEDPITHTALAQDQVVRILEEQDEWYKIETLDGVSGRVPKILANAIENPLQNSSEQLYCSIAQFDGQREGDLCFGVYSIIVVESVESEGWFRGIVVTDTGKRLGNSGTFPATFVKQLSGIEAPANSLAPVQQSAMSSSFTTNFSADVRFRQKDVMPYARAIYDFKGEFENELTFNADDIIYLTRRIDAEWLEGNIGARKGIFPQGFVQVVVALPGEEESSSSVRESGVSGGGSSAAEEGIGFAVVRHDFHGREKDELTVQMGDSVRVIQMVNGDWVQCRDPNTEALGIVPIAFLEVYLDDDEDEMGGRTSVTAEPTFRTLSDQSFNAPSVMSDWRTSTRIDDVSMTSPPAASSAQSHEWATFGEAWLEPENEKKSAPPARPPPPKSTSFNMGIGDIDKLAMNLEEISAGSSESSSSDPQVQKEKRDKVLEELISSEIQFMTDVMAYCEAIDNSSRLASKQKAVMKSGCKQISDLAGSLIQRLTNEQCREWDQQMIGTCFLEMRKPFAQTYGYYFRNIDHINTLVNSSSSDPRMEQALKELVEKMREAGAAVFDAPSAVSRPIQRCVKYPLFLSEIAKFTPIHHPDHPRLLEAVKQMSTLGQKMNESKRRKELTRKYGEDSIASSSSGGSKGGILSKLTVHSIKKKSNRFTYRMGTSLGMVKVVRDPDFDRLVNSLDAMERHLVRFNYNLVVYRKKMFFETRQLIQKKLIDIRKKQVVIAGMSIERQVQIFHDEVKSFSDQLNHKVRDEIVKALRAIPKKLIKKRNDKLMDWEAAKSNMKANSNSKFLDYEALNTQVKQTLPKVIDVLLKVLHDAMITVRSLDEHVTGQLKMRYKEASDEAAKDPYQMQRLIVPGIPCFAHYYDPNRLQPLQFLVTRIEKKMRLHIHTHEISKNSVKRKGSKSHLESATTPTTASVSEPSVWTAAPSVVAESKFRAQNSEERKSILDKAEQKGRRSDMYRCKTDWPASPEALQQNASSGKMLIVKQGDAVLCVRKESGTLWLCYNGYYNAHLPSTILTPWYSAKPSQSEVNGDHPTKTSSLYTRPHSTPPKQQGQGSNLIDLDDFFGGGPAVPSLVPSPLAPLVPTPVGAAATTRPIESQASPFGEVPQDKGPVSIFDDVRPVDWGAPAASTTVNPWESTGNGLRTAPSLPNLAQQPSPTPAFPVTFDDSPKEPTAAPLSHLPPPGPAPTRPVPTPTAPASNNSSQDAFMTLWEQIKDQPLSSMRQRSESPQPLIPTRPDPQPFHNLSSSSNNTSLLAENNSLNYQGSSVLQPSPIQPIYPSIISSYDTVPTIDQTYSLPPQYDAVPWTAPEVAKPNGNFGSTKAAPALYEEPPMESKPSPSLAQYDVPPVETPEHIAGRSKPKIGCVTVNYDFSPVGPNQLAVSEGEVLTLVQAHDDDGNPEWIWVRREGGANGYVPAAYCTRS